MSDEEVAEPPTSDGPFQAQLSATGLFGCFYAALLWLAMAFVVFVGSIMGDCEPGPGCHDNDGAIIAMGLLKAAGVAVIFASVAWVLFAVIRMAIGSRLSPFLTKSILAACLAMLLWLTFSPAMELLLMIGWWD